MLLQGDPANVTRRTWMTICLGGFLVSGCAPGAGLPALPDPPPGPYRVGAGDVVRIITVGNDQLSGKFAVGDDGQIALPFLGAVRAAGSTTGQLAARISGELRERKLFRNPSVVVEMEAYRPVFILGEVNKPGLYPYFPGLTVLSLASVAGGFTYRAFTEYASVLRVEAGHGVTGRIDRSSPVAPEDVVTIFERHF